MRRRSRSRAPLAVVLGRGIEVLRALAMAGAPCAVVSGRGDPARWSRHTRTAIDWNWMQPLDSHDGALAERLVRFGREQDEPPVLAYCSDQPLVFVSRYRETLGEAFRFVVPEATLVEALVDKSRFAQLALEKALPVPHTCVLPNVLTSPPEEVDELTFPVIVKPNVRDATWQHAVEGNAKGVRLATRRDLDDMWPRIRTLSGPAVAQQCVDGPETNVVSYHVYVDRHGLIAGEFSGRKIRTLPAEYGHTSALTVADDPDVIEAGRKITQTLGLRGAAKIDFKQAGDGRLYLLEVNARLTLWAHPGALAGVNLAGLMYADLTERARPPVTAVPPGVDWVHPKDVLAARRAGMPLGTWLRWAATRRAKAVWSWDDPLPLAGMVAVRVKEAVSRPSHAVK